MMLVTPTLLNAFRWYTHCYGEEPEDETIMRDDFLRMLRREPMVAPSDAIMKGRALEEAVEMATITPNEDWPEYIAEIATLVGRRGIWQQSVKKELGGFLLYGRTDHMFADTIDDIKYCGLYDIGKFVRSAQHRIYLYCSGLPRFRYLISDARQVFVEDYYNHAGLEDELRGLIRDFTVYLEGDYEAAGLYYSRWQALS